MPHQRPCIRDEEKQARWLVCGPRGDVSFSLGWVREKKENPVVFVTLIQEPKPQHLLFV